jgi:hypothetical protein
MTISLRMNPTMKFQCDPSTMDPARVIEESTLANAAVLYRRVFGRRNEARTIDQN